MPFMNIVVALLARLQPSLSLLPPGALRIVNPLSKLTAAVGLGSRAAAIGTRIIDFIRAFPTTLTSLSMAKAGVKRLADRFPVLKSWQFWATIFTAASLLFAGLAFWTSFEASQYAKWTAHKDFTLLCMEETTRYLSMECPDAANLSLPVPPGFHGTPTRRDLNPFEDAQDDSPAIRHSFANIGSGYFHQGFWNITNLTADQCRSHTTFWTTVQAAIAIATLISGGLFPSWSLKSINLTRNSLVGSRFLLTNAARQRSGLMWRARSYQCILLLCFHLPHRFLCSDAISSQRATNKASELGPTDAVFIVAGHVLSHPLPLLYALINPCLEDLFRSHNLFKHHDDFEILILEAVYLFWIPFLLSIHAWLDYDLPMRCLWLLIRSCVGSTPPHNLETRLRDHYISWVYYVCSEPDRYSNYGANNEAMRKYPRAFTIFLRRELCIQSKRDYGLGDEDGIDLVEQFPFWYGALLDRSIWDMFGRGLDLLSSFVPCPVWAYIWVCA